MKLFNNFFLGLKSFGKGFEFLLTHKMGWTLFIPVAITIIFFWLGLELTSSLIDITIENLEHRLHLNNNSFFLAKYLKIFLSGFLWLVIKGLFFIVFTYINGYLVLAVLSPLLAIISEKTEKIITGKTYPFSLHQLIHDIIRGILIVLRNLLYEICLSILILILMLIPLIGQIIGVFSPIILFGISSYFYGFSFIDYNSERHKLSVKESVVFTRKNGGLAIANGSIFSLFLMIPVLGSFIAGIIAIISTVSATLAVLEIKQQNGKNKHN
ncbi:MAG TPA: hypothetical protein EYP69_05910 [Bacteroidales bacterium]|nr:hypothetical protein [Bacteroidales bacterium]